ncbi:FAD-binding domain-containing protein [Stemphylium lycopersici]|nr:FAD-binding domain-containing protein [Stemphylium lycopersici]
MKTSISLTTLVAGVVSQATFEPANFDVTEALLSNGVNVSALPELANFAEKSLLSGCSTACNSLKLIFGDDQVETQSESAYTAFVGNYWSAQQRQISPQCVFEPETALDVSTAILLSRLTQCPFAAKSGGHSPVPGGSNIEGGITISFQKMNKTVPSADRKSASFQPGQTWYDVYTTLEKSNVTIIGGRVASVGVGGLTLGVGISYFSGLYGLACDNVNSFEVVTASGLIIDVTKDSFPDLYWALRGGGNNFGLVTKFDVAAVPRDPTMWGGMRTYLSTAFPALIQAYYNLGVNAVEDGKAHQILSFGWGGDQLGPVANVEMEYSDPIPNAAIFNEYNAIKGAIRDQTAIRSLAELTSLLDGPATGDGLRQSFWTWSTKLDAEQATIAKDIFFEELPKIVDAADLVPAISLQVLSEPIIENGAKDGGNPLGLDPEEGPLMLALVALKWSDSADDQRIQDFASTVMERSVAAAEAAGKANDYLYMNYGSPWQDVIASYGSENKAKLKAISKKYDPSGVFERLQPGHFKLDGAPWGAY